MMAIPERHGAGVLTSYTKVSKARSWSGLPIGQTFDGRLKSMAGNKVLLDVATAGASGDMFLSALMDLLGKDDSLLPVAASLLIFDPTLRIRVTNRILQRAQRKAA